MEEDRVHPKKRVLLDIVAAELQAGRRVLAYVTHACTRDIIGRLQALLTRRGARVAVLRPMPWRRTAARRGWRSGSRRGWTCWSAILDWCRLGWP